MSRVTEDVCHPPPRGCRREGGTIAGVSLEAVTPSGTNGRRDPHHTLTGKKRCFRCPSHLSSRPPQTSPGTSKRRLLREARPHPLGGGRRPCLLLGPASVHLLVSVSVKSEAPHYRGAGADGPLRGRPWQMGEGGAHRGPGDICQSVNGSRLRERLVSQELFEAGSCRARRIARFGLQ